jgi:outer membrane protein TolC
MLRLLLVSCFALGSLGLLPARAADLTLDDCLRTALDHNPELRAASEQFLAAQGQALKLHAILYPSVTAQGLT